MSGFGDHGAAQLLAVVADHGERGQQKLLGLAERIVEVLLGVVHQRIALHVRRLENLLGLRLGALDDLGVVYDMLGALFRLADGVFGDGVGVFQNLALVFDDELRLAQLVGQHLPDTV